MRSMPLPVKLAILVCAVLGTGAAQATATGALSSFTVTPSSTQAGGNPGITADLTFSYGNGTDSVKDVTINLAPGIVASIANVPATCSPAELSTNTCPPGSKVGTGGVTLAGEVTPRDVDLYLMPAPTPGDGAGFGAVLVVGATVYTGLGSLDIVTGVDGRPVGVVKLGVPVVTGEVVDRLVATMNATTTDGKAFTRMPTSCENAISTGTVETTEASTGSGESSFLPSGCPALLYSPSLSAVEVTGEPGGGAAMVVSISQPNAATESATKSLAIDMPPSLVPNVDPAAACLNGTSCTIGTATATSPLMPDSYLSAGTVTLGGTGAAPTVTVSFPEPVALSITGTVDVPTGVVTFPNVPDLPFGTLRVAITGAPGGKVLHTTCEPADLVARFTPQSGGATVTSTSPIVYRNCTPPPKPTPPTPKPLRVSIQSKRVLVDDDHASVTLACRGGAAGSTCRGTLSLTRRVRIVRHVHHHRKVIHRTIVLARTRYAVASASTKGMTPQLTAAGLRLLAHDDDGRLRAKATATLKGGPTAQRAVVVQSTD